MRFKALTITGLILIGVLFFVGSASSEWWFDFDGSDVVDSDVEECENTSTSCQTCTWNAGAEGEDGSCKCSYALPVTRLDCEGKPGRCVEQFSSDGKIEGYICVAEEVPVVDDPVDAPGEPKVLKENGELCEGGHECKSGECKPDGKFCCANLSDSCSSSRDCCSNNCGPGGSCIPFMSAGSSSSVCGNGSIEAGEKCDDGNTINGDGCSSICQIQEIQPAQLCGECGNGWLNICDKDECSAIGQCVFVNRTFRSNLCMDGVNVNFTVKDGLFQQAQSDVGVSVEGAINGQLVRGGCITNNNGVCSGLLIPGNNSYRAFINDSRFVIDRGRLTTPFAQNITVSNTGSNEVELNPYLVRCVDSDPENDLYKTGELSQGSRAQQDKCSVGALYQYKCVNGFIVGDKPYYCSLGCENGVCLTPEAPEEGEDPVTSKVTFYPGVVGVRLSVSPGSDKCITGSDSSCFLELNPGTYTVSVIDRFYSCSAAFGCPKTFTVVPGDNIVSFILQKIPLKIDICDDTDGGLKYYKKGVAKSHRAGATDQVIIDRCAGKTIPNPETRELMYTDLIEAYCDHGNNIVWTEKFVCPEACEDGVCVGVEPEPIDCTDTDTTPEFSDGLNFIKKGTATDIFGSYTDFCTEDGAYLEEYYCKSNDQVGKTIKQCTNDGCRRGVCIEDDEEEEEEDDEEEPSDTPIDQACYSVCSDVYMKCRDNRCDIYEDDCEDKSCNAIKNVCLIKSNTKYSKCRIDCVASSTCVNGCANSFNIDNEKCTDNEDKCRDDCKEDKDGCEVNCDNGIMYVAPIVQLDDDDEEGNDNDGADGEDPDDTETPPAFVVIPIKYCSDCGDPCKEENCDKSIGCVFKKKIFRTTGTCKLGAPMTGDAPAPLSAPPVAQVAKTCSECGDGLTNFCDIDECPIDCLFNPRFGLDRWGTCKEKEAGVGYITPTAGGQFQKGSIGVLVPAGAVDVNARIYIGSVSGTPVPKEQGKAVPGGAFEYVVEDLDGNEIHEFDQPITISITYTAEQVGGMDKSNLKMYILNRTTWEPAQNTQVDIHSDGSVTLTSEI